MAFADNSALEVLGARCFQGIGAEEITIPASVKTFGEGAFRKSSVRRVKFANESSLMHIGSGCFADSAVEEFCLPGRVTTIGRGAFEHCSRLATVYVEDDCTIRIREHVGEEVVVFPSRQTMLGSKSLWEYRGQKKVKVPEGVWAIKAYWFAQSDIESVTVPTSVGIVQDYAFCECKNLRKATLPKFGLLETLGQWCFAGSAVEEIVFPQDLETIGAHAFQGCRSLQRVTFNKGLKCIGEAAFQDAGLEAAELPATLRTLQKRAFCGCSHLKQVGVPEGLREVDDEVFRDADIEEVRIPMNVRRIGSGAFAGCARLKKLTFGPNSLLDKVEDGAFGGTGLQFDESIFPKGAAVLASAFKTQ